MSDPSPLTLDRFTPHVGASFPLEGAGGEGLPDQPLAAVLVEASPLEGGRPEAPREGFSLLFHVAGAGHLPQRTYTVRHPEEGPVTLFLVPVGLRDGGVLLEAVFN